MAKILVDVHMLCLVDVALALRAVEALLRAEERRAVVVVYAGADHVRKQAKFWRAQGFTCEGLPQEGLVGQEDYEVGRNRWNIEESHVSLSVFDGEMAKFGSLVP